MTQLEVNHIASIPDSLKVAEWERGTVLMKGIRSSITSQLNTIQNEKCCYCGLQLWETARGEIDHIAPKASRHKAYPEFTFVKQNLALSCEYCNGSNKKGERNTILRYNSNYQNCDFKIVHPYFDVPNHHFEWINQRTQVVIRHKTWKGKYSIILFQLKDLANARAKQRIYEKKLRRIKNVQNIFEKFKKITYFQ